MHWRANGAVKDWTSLKEEVRTWQIVASLAWSEDDVLEVARYLNDTIYHFERTNQRPSSTKACAERLGSSLVRRAKCGDLVVALPAPD